MVILTGHYVIRSRAVYDGKIIIGNRRERWKNHDYGLQRAEKLSC